MAAVHSGSMDIVVTAVPETGPAQTTEAEQTTSVVDVEQIVDGKMRCLMLCCPCKYFSDPNAMGMDCCMTSTGLQAIPPLIQIGGTHRSSISIPRWFVVVRAVLSVLMVYITIFSIAVTAARGAGQWWLIWMTNWSLLLCTALMMVRIYSTVTIFALQQEEDTATVNNGETKDLKRELAMSMMDLRADRPLWRLYVAQNVLLQVSVPVMATVCLGYFMFEMPGSWNTAGEAINAIQVHSVSLLCVWGDFMLSAERYPFKSVIWPCVFGFAYLVWTGIYGLAGGHNDDGDPYIYENTSSVTSAAIISVITVLQAMFFAVMASLLKRFILTRSAVFQ